MAPGGERTQPAPSSSGAAGAAAEEALVHVAGRGAAELQKPCGGAARSSLGRESSSLGRGLPLRHQQPQQQQQQQQQPRARRGSAGILLLFRRGQTPWRTPQKKPGLPPRMPLNPPGGLSPQRTTAWPGGGSRGPRRNAAAAPQAAPMQLRLPRGLPLLLLRPVPALLREMDLLLLPCLLQQKRQRGGATGAGTTTSRSSGSGCQRRPAEQPPGLLVAAVRGGRGEQGAAAEAARCTKGRTLLLRSLPLRPL